jgi:hypothetical protein
MEALLEAGHDMASCDEQQDDAIDEISVLKNKLACSKGKIKKLNTRVMAWELTAKFRPVNTEELDTIHEKIWNDIKTY